MLLFAFALAAFAVAQAPARFFLKPAEGLFSYDRVEGTIWKARFHGVSLGGIEADEADWRFDLWGLVNGKFVADVSLKGKSASGEVQLLANREGDRRIVIPGLQLEGARLDGLALAGHTSVQNLDIYFDNGRCAAASGQVQSDILAANPNLAGNMGGALSGAARCDGADALIDLTGAGQASLSLRLRGNGEAEWRLAGPSATSSPDAPPLALSGQMRWTPF